MASARAAAPAGAAGRRRRRSPASWLSAYDEFITKNLGQVSQIESTLRSLTYIIPGRFRDAEIASETIHSGVQLLSLYHDLLLLRTPPPSPPRSPSPPPPPPPPAAAAGPLHALSHHSRYTRFWIQKSPLYRRVAIVLQIVRYTELLCEMAAKRRGERLRWRVVVLIEAIKAVCRLVLLRVTRGRTLVSPALPVRQPLPTADDEEDEEMVTTDDEEEKEAAAGDGTRESKAGQEHNTTTTTDKRREDLASAGAAAVQGGKPNGPATYNKTSISPQPPLSPPPSPSRSTAELVPPPETMPAGHTPAPPSPPPTEREQQSAQSSSSSLSSSPLKSGWSMPRTGMALPPLPQPGDISAYLLSRQAAQPAARLRPAYALALARSSSGQQRRTAWTPWLAGLAMECAARQLRDHSIRTTTLERDEWNRRGWAMGWWAMRGAFYEHVTKGAVAGVRSRMPGFVSGIIEDYEYLWENYYFSTSS
ncbi:peroxisomal membrane protein pex16 [Niveomyces insectorum RCEF 264]|uniref:Peroxisomal membrane protein PEX16 n=1 Tax=Niveomyces insectorum RCEF 264 TaxID=1081102 RepID=A0A167UTM0_9HYPO|nr:peroxisomal membrane protein pex16 [Niveomyces insectorum RCEF 264]